MPTLLIIKSLMGQRNHRCVRHRRRLIYSLYKITAVFGIASAALVLGSGQVVAQERKLSPQATQQMRVLLDEKAARTPAQRKISSSLLLHGLQRQGSQIIASVPSLRSSVKLSEDATTLIDIRTTGQAALDQIAALGGTVVNSFPRYKAIRARVPIDQLAALAESSDVVSIRPADQLQIHQANTSEGDRTHRADNARTALGVDGTGVSIGVLSDSVDALADLQSSNDLPAVTVLTGQSGNPGTSEGTAMLEIVHDLAPGAQLLFATAFGGRAQFAQNILDLGAAGCDVIVDDVSYFAEPVFQDGIIAQAVDTVVANGAQYYSSAGNSGNLNDLSSGVWEGDYVQIAAPAAITVAGDAHDFGGANNFNQITRDSPSVFTLQWSDPQGGSANDYDLFLLSPDLGTVLASSTDTQDGNDDPFEQISSQDANGNNIDDTNTVLVIIRNPGAQNRFLHLNTNRGRLDISTDGQTGGHSAAAGAFSVAAVDVATAGSGAYSGGTANPVELFSSDGPRRIFYQADGTPITPADFSATGGVLRQKPDIAAADGVSTATPGFDPFFGTSAAAPHAAAIGGLLLDSDPTLTPAEARAIFNATALDIEAPGVDRDSGAGIVMADLALNAIGGTTPVADLSVAKSASPTPAVLTYTITVSNAGPADAEDVVVTEALPSGVTFVSTSGCAEDGNGVPACTLGTIPAGGSRQYTITTSVTTAAVGLLAGQPVVNTSTPGPGPVVTPLVTVTGDAATVAVPTASGQDAGAGNAVSIDINIRVPVQGAKP